MIRSHQFPNEVSFWRAKKYVESLGPERVNGMLFVDIDFPEFLQDVRRVGVAIGCRGLEMKFYGSPKDTWDLIHDCTTRVEEEARPRPYPINL